MEERSKQKLKIQDITSILRSVAGVKERKYFTSAVIAAGGSSVRMGGSVPKLLMELDGKPVLAHTLLAYQNSASIDEIIISAKADLIDDFKKICEDYNITKLTKIVPAGENRSDSVRAGLDVIDDRATFIAIADGARCMTTTEMIDRVCCEAHIFDCASAGMPAVDTVKICDKGKFVESTPDRNMVWYAQTPQVFKVSVYRAAAYIALEEKFKATDDNQMVEHLRIPVKMVDCGNENIKITNQFDLVCAEALLELRRKREQEKQDIEDGRYKKYDKNR